MGGDSSWQAALQPRVIPLPHIRRNGSLETSSPKVDLFPGGPGGLTRARGGRKSIQGERCTRHTSWKARTKEDGIRTKERDREETTTQSLQGNQEIWVLKGLDHRNLFVNKKAIAACVWWGGRSSDVFLEDILMAFVYSAEKSGHQISVFK